jgi:hypothetical protein
MPAVRTRRVLIIGVVTLICVAAISSIILWKLNDPFRSPARRAWRDQAVQKVYKRTLDNAWLDTERARLASQAATRPFNGGWVGDEMLVMQNGEWIVCENVCAKEQNTPVRKYLFIGRGSDARWYYSTFHFCVGKNVLMMEPQPGSLAQFVDGSWLVPFDGMSDESLQSTWEPGARR